MHFCPAGQGVQVVWAGAECVPALQATGDADVLEQENPAGHAVQLKTYKKQYKNQYLIYLKYPKIKQYNTDKQKIKYKRWKFPKNRKITKLNIRK